MVRERRPLMTTRWIWLALALAALAPATACSSSDDDDEAGDADADGDADTCNPACGRWSHCEGGGCVCDDFFTECDGTCLRLGTDENCGGCGDACQEDYRCIGGECVAPCGGACEAGEECCDWR